MLDIIASYKEFQVKLMNQTWENCKKPTISLMIYWDFLMFYQISLSPQVKPRAIITYKYGIYELPNQLLKDLRLRILGN